MILKKILLRQDHLALDSVRTEHQKIFNPVTLQRGDHAKKNQTIFGRFK